MSEHCATCRFYHDINMGGQCRRRAPVTDATNIHATALWPWVSDYEWCGEYEPRKPHE